MNEQAEKSTKELADLFRQLTVKEKDIILDLTKSLLSARR